MALTDDEKKMPAIQFALDDLLDDVRDALDDLIGNDSTDEFSDTTLTGYLAGIQGEHETAGDVIQKTANQAFGYFKARPGSGYEEGQKVARANQRDPRGLELDTERDQKRHAEQRAAFQAFKEEQERRNGIKSRDQ